MRECFTDHDTQTATEEGSKARHRAYQVLLDLLYLSLWTLKPYFPSAESRSPQLYFNDVQTINLSMTSYNCSLLNYPNYFELFTFVAFMILESHQTYEEQVSMGLILNQCIFDHHFPHCLILAMDTSKIVYAHSHHPYSIFFMLPKSCSLGTQPDQQVSLKWQ